MARWLASLNLDPGNSRLHRIDRYSVGEMLRTLQSLEIIREIFDIQNLRRKLWQDTILEKPVIMN